MTGENLVFNPRRLALVGVAAVGLTLAASAPVKAQVRYDPAYDTPYTTEEIVVTPRVIGRSAIGAPIELVTASRVVPIRDLDLGTSWGRATLRPRVPRAAPDACDELDARYPDTGGAYVPAGDSPPCFQTAVHNAKRQVEDKLGYQAQL